jgi:hypothetical protein
LIEMIATAATANRALHPEGCLFCRPHDGGFESEEHIFSYALGNREYTLPPGIVCDRCNKGPLAKADEAISSFPPIQMLRGERGLGTRKKKPLVLSMHVTEVWWEAPGEMCIRAANAGVMMRTGASSGTLNLTSLRPTPPQADTGHQTDCSRSSKRSDYAEESATEPSKHNRSRPKLGITRDSA